MRRVLPLTIALFAAFVIAGCSRMEGLRLLTGETADAQTDATVESLELIMADKTGASDPALMSAADRVEQASASVDIIEIRKDVDARIFQVILVWAPPVVDLNTQEGQFAFLDNRRRALELTWQGMMTASRDSDVLNVQFLRPEVVNTLDNGRSYIATVVSLVQIDRADAVAYLTGQRSLTTFVDLIVAGSLVFLSPRETIYYEGQPNHPVFMLPTNPSTAAQ